MRIFTVDKHRSASKLIGEIKWGELISGLGSFDIYVVQACKHRTDGTADTKFDALWLSTGPLLGMLVVESRDDDDQYPTKRSTTGPPAERDRKHPATVEVEENF